jgi:hypothetical protein
MTRQLAGCLALAALSLVPAASTADVIPAQGPAVYDTVDAVEVWGSRIIVTGIIAGQGTPSEINYIIFDGTSGTTSPEGANRCDRLALLAIAKPGKYQFATTLVPGFGLRFGCKLIVRTP